MSAFVEVFSTMNGGQKVRRGEENRGLDLMERLEYLMMTGAFVQYWGESGIIGGVKKSQEMPEDWWWG